MLEYQMLDNHTSVFQLQYLIHGHRFFLCFLLYKSTLQLFLEMEFSWMQRRSSYSYLESTCGFRGLGLFGCCFESLALFLFLIIRMCVVSHNEERLLSVTAWKFSVLCWKDITQDSQLHCQVEKVAKDYMLHKASIGMLLTQNASKS